MEKRRKRKAQFRVHVDGSMRAHGTVSRQVGRYENPENHPNQLQKLKKGKQKKFPLLNQFQGKRNPQKQKQKLEKVAVARSERLRRVGPKLYQLFWTWVTPWARRLRRLNWGFPLRLSKRPTYLTLDGDESPHSIAFPVSYDSSRDSAEEGSSQPTFYPIGPYTFLVNLASSRLRPSVPIPRPYYLGGPCFLLLMELLL
ncbi:hypothetical protein V6N12_076141 [Hibiscus sabdariffa]|uniref:Uncharacterized protein n=1 Tax=Hibiscus sabdariffa TaxID=183260 RepID=A0ABR2B011_9ROSI